MLTDKINRSVAAVREVVKDCGGKMADPGSISFKFKRARVVNVKVKDADRDQILAVALDAGADDVIEPSADEDDPEDEINEMYKILFICIYVYQWLVKVFSCPDPFMFAFYMNLP